jgi:hypothetical protein
MRMPGILAIVAILAIPAFAPAGVVFVDAANASGVENGSAEFPFNTIQEAIDACPAGTVSVARGIYFGALVAKRNVALVSQKGPEQTIIDGMGAYSAILPPPSATPNTYLDGFTIRNAIILLNHYNRFIRYQSCTLTVDNCILEASNTAVNCSAFAGLNMSRTVVTGGGISGWISYMFLKNVTMDGCPTALSLNQTSAELFNTTITNSTSGILAYPGTYSSGGLTGSNNNIYNCPITLYPGRWPPRNDLVNTLSVDPLFVTPSEDYHLQEASLLIDAGIDLGLPFLGTAPDIGAYEFGRLSPAELIENLAEAFQNVPAGAFKNAGEERKNALDNKFQSILKMIMASYNEPDAQVRLGQYNAAINRLENDIMPKVDGFYGGNPNNDWITSKEEQAAVYPLLAQTLEELRRLVTEIGN